MSTENKKFPAIFIGKKTLFKGWFAIEEKNGEDHLYLKEKPRNFFDAMFNQNGRWRVVFKNIKEELKRYQIKNVIDSREGITSQQVYFYAIDFHNLDTFEPMMPQEKELEKQDLQTKLDYKERLLLSAYEFIDKVGMREGFQKYVSQNYQFYTNSLKPSWAYSQNKDDKGAKK